LFAEIWGSFVDILEATRGQGCFRFVLRRCGVHGLMHTGDSRTGNTYINSMGVEYSLIDIRLTAVRVLFADILEATRGQGCFRFVCGDIGLFWDR